MSEDDSNITSEDQLCKLYSPLKILLSLCLELNLDLVETTSSAGQ